MELFLCFLRGSSLNLASRLVVPTVCFFVGNLVCEIVFFSLSSDVYVLWLNIVVITEVFL